MATFDPPVVPFVPFTCPTCCATKPKTSAVRTKAGTTTRDHECKGCGTRYRSVECSVVERGGTTRVVAKNARAFSARTAGLHRVNTPATRTAIEEVLTEVILTLVEIREAAPTHMERCAIEHQMDRLRAHLRDAHHHRSRA